MRLSIAILLSLILFTSCNNSKSKKELSAQEKQDLSYNNAAAEVSDQHEKILLLAVIKKVPYDTLREILIHYYALTSDYQYSADSSQIICNDAIESISENYHISREKIASLIFSFKYEMQTKEEIEQRAIDNLESEAQDEQESDDSRY